MELAQYGITANVYCPGIIDTDMSASAYEALGQITGAPPGNVLKGAVTQVPLGRIGEPDDIANLVSFLASRNSDCESQ